MNSSNKHNKAEYFHSLAEGWDEKVGNNQDRAVKIRNVFSMIDLKQGDKVLDVGCGNGVLLRLIEEKTGNGGSITALDAARGMIDKAKELHKEFRNIDYVTGFIEDTDLPEDEYNVVICYAVLPHIDDMPAALSRINSILTREGKLYIFHPASTKDLNDFHSNLDAPVNHDILPDEDRMRALLSDAGFKVKSYIDEPGLNFVECSK